MKGRKTEKEKRVGLFVDWLATPEEERLIKTQKEYATFIGVDEHTLGRWKAQLAETDVGDEVERFRKQVYRQAMRVGATAKHMELYAKLKGLWDKPEISEERPKTADEICREGLALEVVVENSLREWHFESLKNRWGKVSCLLYGKEDIEGILQWARGEGVIDDFREVPSVFLGYHLPSKCVKEIPLARSKEEGVKRMSELNSEKENIDPLDIHN